MRSWEVRFAGLLQTVPEGLKAEVEDPRRGHGLEYKEQ